MVKSNLFIAPLQFFESIALESQKFEEKKIMRLEEMKKEIETLVIEKGFYNKPEDIPKKLLFAFIELGEASDAWKKGEAEEEIAEELVDVVFYVLDASRLACPTVNMDEMFKKKLEKNLGRPFQYGEGHRKNSPRAFHTSNEITR